MAEQGGLVLRLGPGQHLKGLRSLTWGLLGRAVHPDSWMGERPQKAGGLLFHPTALGLESSKLTLLVLRIWPPENQSTQTSRFSRTHADNQIPKPQTSGPTSFEG